MIFEDLFCVLSLFDCQRNAKEEEINALPDMNSQLQPLRTSDVATEDVDDHYCAASDHSSSESSSAEIIDVYQHTNDTSESFKPCRAWFISDDWRIERSEAMETMLSKSREQYEVYKRCRRPRERRKRPNQHQQQSKYNTSIREA